MKATPKVWNTFLLIATMMAAFVLPALPMGLQKSVDGAFYMFIYVMSVFSLKGRSGRFTAMMIAVILMQGVSSLIDFETLYYIVKGVNVLFFTLIVSLMIRQIAMADRVDAAVILESIIGYLLMGIVYSIFVSVILRIDPGAYNLAADQMGEAGAGNISAPFYFGFITLTTVGYGDILPLKPYARALSTWIAVSGQFYMAVIVALLVGKFAATQGRKGDSTSE